MANRGFGTPQEGESTVIREEMSRLFTLEERHRRLLARLFLTLALTVVVFAAGAILTWVFESGQKGGDIRISPPFCPLSNTHVSMAPAAKTTTVSANVRNSRASSRRCRSSSVKSLDISSRITVDSPS